ncbi:hypothetical protein LY76DRAFT_44689 [Colletotrichum caudatum]|nr:hypothetical protein LY76DRAFT_44689 [Colletotrichum caudatum]
MDVAIPLLSCALVLLSSLVLRVYAPRPARNVCARNPAHVVMKFLCGESHGDAREKTSGPVCICRGDCQRHHIVKRWNF